MALVLKDRVKETTTTTGTSSFTLAGAVTGYDSFGQIGTGNTTYYACYLDGGTEWEVGIGTYTAPSTLSRDTILASSAAGAKVSFSAGQKTIWCDYPAGKAVYLDAAGSISEPIVNISGITGYINSPDYVQFDTNYATPLGVGQLGWDGNNTLAVGMAGGNVIQHIGEDQYFYIKASATITKGQLIMFTGAVGASGVLTGAPSTGVTVPEYIMGVAAESIANNGFGLVQCFGELTNVNTNGFNEGDVLYYDSAVTGGLTNVYPSSGIIVTVAAVAKKSAGGGVLSIRLTETPRISASTGISVSQTNAGATITNTAPDQVVSLSAGTGISVTGTYPSFTVTNTSPSTGGDVTGPASSTDNAIARFDQTTGKIIQNSVVTVSDTGEFTGVSTLNAANIIIADNATLGSTTADTIAFNGRIVTGIEPDATNSYDIGSSGKTWRSAFIGTTLNTVNLAVTGTVSFDADQGTAGQVLTSAGSGNTPTWTTPAAGTVTSVSGTAPIASSGGNTPTISITQAGTASNGYLSSTDWNTFNNKQPAGTYVTSVGATSPVTSTGGTTPTIAMPAANGSTNGYLTSTDWTTFNSKGSGSVTSVSTGTGLTGGPITTTGTISLANTAVTPASYTYASITVDAQGRLTAASSGTAPVTSVSGTAPIASSGGTTPAISIPKATGSVDGYLSSTDWTTFNNKGNGTVTSVTGTSPVASSGGATPAISLSSGYGDTQNPYASKTANNFLAAPNGSAGVPTFRAIVAADIPTLNQNTTGTAANVTGTVAIANGGTGQTTAAAAFNALNPMTTTGDIIYEDSGGVAARLGIGSSGQVLTVSAGKPAWGAAASSNITTNGLWENAATISANYTIGTNNNAVSAGPITVSTGVTVTVPTGSTWTVV